MNRHQIVMLGLVTVAFCGGLLIASRSRPDDLTEKMPEVIHSREVRHAGTGVLVGLFKSDTTQTSGTVVVAGQELTQIPGQKSPTWQPFEIELSRTLIPWGDHELAVWTIPDEAANKLRFGRSDVIMRLDGLLNSRL